MKHIITILVILLIVPLVFFACANNALNGQVSNASDASASGQTTNDMTNDQTSKELDCGKPINKEELFDDIGKTLSVLKNEHLQAEILIRDDGFPHAAAVGFGEREGKYMYLFFETQDGDAESAMNELEEQLKCAGFMTTAGVLFPEMEGDMSFSAFFSLIGVSDYEYGIGESNTVAEGWLDFTYNNMGVLINTNEFTGSFWEFTAAEKVKCSAPVVITDKEILKQNQNIVDSVMFEY